MFKRFRLLAAVMLVSPGTALYAQAPVQGTQAAAAPATICGQKVPPPTNLPPAGSGPVLWLMAPCFESQGNVSLIDQQTYLYYIQLKDKLSSPLRGVWVPYDASIEQIIREDFLRLWNTNFLDNINIHYEDYTFSNGVIGRMVIYDLEERQRVRNVDYVGSKKVERPKIEEKLKELNTTIRLDTFIDPGLIRKVEGIVREMLKAEGFQFSSVTHQIQPIAGGPKLVNLVFTLDEGPKVKIRKVEFDGNQAASDRALRKRLKENKPRGFFSFITGRGTYKEAKFEEDADRVMVYYLDRGYISAQVGTPELKFIDDPSDKDTRWVEIRIPVREGNRYRIGNFEFAGNKIVKTEALRPLFKLKAGDYYSQKEIQKGLQKAQEVYGAGGYMEFTGYPEPRPRDLPNPAEPVAPAAIAAEPQKPTGPPVVDVTMRIQEGQQYFVNRIVFVGNTTTRDSVIRREMRLYENGVFNSEALKYSIRRLNQLGYFKALEGPPKDVTVDKTAGPETKVDVRLQLEEQNRNQLTFGAGVSQFEGFFGQLSFQTANFLGRGESLTVAIQAGSRAQNYTLAFTEPFLFDRNITGGLNLFKNEIRYIGQFTQKSIGGVLTFGFPLGSGFTRMFTNYSYEQTRVSEINAAFCDPLLLARNPFLRDSLLLSGASCGIGATSTETDPLTGLPITVPIAGGAPQRVVSKVVPSLVYNTVDQPIFPTTGRRFTTSFDVAGLGGNTKFLKPMAEGVWFLRQNSRMTLGMRGRIDYVRTYGSTRELPIFEKLFLGGEYDIRGFDIRTIGPQDPTTGLVLGGNKSLLFNVEQIVHIAGPVRLILFYDAGQVRDIGQAFAWKEDKTERVPPPQPLLFDPFATVSLTYPDAPGPQTVVVGRQSAFKTSTGAEVRFFMPVLNVPFRLIFAYNPQRHGILDNRLQQQKAFQFRFAVGTTF